MSYHTLFYGSILGMFFITGFPLAVPFCCLGMAGSILFDFLGLFMFLENICVIFCYSNPCGMCCEMSFMTITNLCPLIPLSEICVVAGCTGMTAILDAGFMVCMSPITGLIMDLNIMLAPAWCVGLGCVSFCSCYLLPITIPMFPFCLSLSAMCLVTDMFCWVFEFSLGFIAGIFVLFGAPEAMFCFSGCMGSLIAKYQILGCCSILPPSWCCFPFNFGVFVVTEFGCIITFLPTLLGFIIGLGGCAIFNFPCCGLILRIPLLCGYFGCGVCPCVPMCLTSTSFCLSSNVVFFEIVGECFAIFTILPVGFWVISIVPSFLCPASCCSLCSTGVGGGLLYQFISSQPSVPPPPQYPTLPQI